MHHFFCAAKFALDLAAPVKGAVTSLHHEHGLSPIPSAATHEVAAVHTDTSIVTGAPVCSGDAQSRILFAETRR